MASNSKKTDYESLRNELDQIIAKLQDDATKIDESLALYETGSAIVLKLSTYLKEAENKLTKISSGLGKK